MNRENLDNNAQNPDAASWDMSDAPAFNSEQQDSGIYGNAVYEPASDIDTGIFGNAVYEPANDIDTGIYGNATYEASDEIKTKEQLNAERQQRKIIAAFLTESGGHIGKQAIIDHDSTIPEGAREEVLDRINSGQIDQALERDLLHSIQSPMDLDGGALNVISKFDNKHEYRIVAWLSGHGFDNFQTLSPGNLDDMYRAYPTPLDFEHTLPQLVEHIRKYNGDEKAAQYQAAGESLMQKMYGKQCEYWKQIKVLNAEAEERKKFRNGETQQLDASAIRAEAERSSEWEPGTVAFYQTSREQAAGGVVSRENIENGLYATDSCEDSVMSRPDKALFGVFDGAGGMGHGRDASSFAAEAMAQISDNYEINSAQDLADSLRLVQHNMAQRGVEGMTTATITKLLRRADGFYAAYASMGDSRMYIVHDGGMAELITQDEGFENKITNCLSSGFGYNGVKQIGEVRLKRGDKIVLCSDGITGDKGADLMSESELGGIVARSTSSEDASKNLVAGARKRDDRTALVIGEF